MLRGVVYLLLAQVAFSSSTVFLKMATQAPFFVDPSIATLARFAMGFAVFGGLMAVYRERYIPNNPSAVAFRAVMNTLAVILFFAAVKYTTVTKANLLNLTYPAFVFLVAPFIADEKQGWHDYLLLATTLIGAGLVVLGGGGAWEGINRGDILALGSGIVAGFGVSGLRQARKFDSSLVILFYQMGIGTVASLFLIAGHPQLPAGMALALTVLTAALSNLGQFFITEGYRYISASLGGIVLESGILFGAVFGILIFNDPLTMTIVSGGLLILASIAAVSLWHVRARSDEQRV